MTNLVPFLDEAQQLREEIANRTRISNVLQVAALAGLGTAAPIILSVPDLAPAVAFFVSVLWLQWLDHTEQIHKIATYIDLRIKPVVQTEEPAALGWEVFLRELDAGGARAARALFGDRTDPARRTLRRGFLVILYNDLLFGLVPPGLLVGYATWFVTQPPSDVLARGFGSGAAFVLWVYSVRERLLFKRDISILNEAIFLSDAMRQTPADDPAGSGSNK